MLKSAIITGAFGQLGKAFVATLLSENYKIYAVDRNIPEDLNYDEHRLKAVQVDITSESEVVAFFSHIESIDVLINNAGIGVYTRFEDRTVDEFKDVMNVNLLGTFLMTREAVKIMKRRNKGAIINIGSIYGTISSDSRIYGDSGRNNSEIYSATKAGIIQMTRYLSAYLAKNNIQVNCISPGGVFNNQAESFVKEYTFRNPTGRMAEPNDLQSALRLFILEDSSYITGQNLIVDGGHTIW